ncbi:MAG: hypothetical protein E5W78_14380 [Mesorhizobium sp.]|nr:MAG: hypothetical protein E5W78_14380 [Mesorhizobium sp.]
MLVLLSSSGGSYRSFPSSRLFLIVLEKLVVAQGRRHHIAAAADGMMPNSMKMSCGTRRVMAAVLPKQ